MISFHQLKLKGADSTMLSQSQMYLISTNLELFLWIGHEVESQRQKGALYILKSFLNTYVYEYVTYNPSYLDDQQNLYNVRMSIEHQFYESPRFRSFFYKVWNDDRLSFLMLRLPWKTGDDEELKEDEELDFDSQFRLSHLDADQEESKKRKTLARDQA